MDIEKTKTSKINDCIENDELLKKLTETYYGIFIIDITKDTFKAINFPKTLNYAFSADKLYTSLDAEVVIRSVVSENDQNRLIEFLNFESLSSRFDSYDDKNEMIYYQSSGRWIKAIVQPLVIKNKVTQKILLTLSDITEARIQYEELLSKNIQITKKVENYENLLYNAASDTYVGILKINLTLDEVSRIEFTTNGLIEKRLADNWNKVYRDLINEIHPDDRANIVLTTHPSSMAIMNEGKKFICTYRIKRNDGLYHWFSSTVRLMVGEKDKTATIFTMDITNDIDEKTRLKDISEHDELTDLYNRVKLEQMIKDEYMNLDTCGVLFFDINCLKEYNDTKGHAEGDRLLCLAADSIRSITNRYIHAYRYGGDEFIVVICNCTKNEINNLIDQWMSRLKTLSANANIVCEIAVGKSYSKKPIEIMDLIRKADIDMYQCKNNMKNKNRRYNEAFNNCKI